MPFADAHQIVGAPITCHAFNSDRTQVALCPNNNEVHIYARQGNAWALAHVLAEHDQLVTGIDWAPETNRLVTCSQDRNAYVWTYSAATSSWAPKLVLLRLTRAATCVRWSPSETKFAVGSGGKLAAVCYFEEENDWWVSKHIKKGIKSTVLCIDWHPNSVLIATGGADYKARVFSAFIKATDAKPAPTCWGDKLPFGHLCAEYPTGGWIHDIKFSPSGDWLGYVSHDSTVAFASPSASPEPQVTYAQTTPYTTLLFTSESAVVVAGHDCAPMQYVKSASGAWEAGAKVDDADGDKKVTASASGSIGRSAGGLQNLAAFNKFRQMDTRAQTESKDTNLTSVHQNTVTCMRPYTTAPGEPAARTVSAFSSSGIDGKIVMWNLLEANLAGLRI